MDETVKHQILLIEELAANAWVPSVNQQIGTWRLRAADGITKRANSVLTSGAWPAVENWYMEAVSFYQRRGLPVRFHVSDGSPADLDAWLHSLGYAMDTPCLVLQASCSSVLAAIGQPVDGKRSFRIELCESPPQPWLDALMNTRGYPPERRPFYERLFPLVGPRQCFASAWDGASIVAIASIVVERGWAGLYNLATLPSHRRQGVATQLIASLIEWSQAHGANDVYLQVERDNLPAMTLYGRIGLRSLYSYHYRVKPLC